METKVCTKCKQELPIEDFNWRNKANNTRRSECKYCHSEHMKNLNRTKRDLVTQIKATEKCCKCGETRSYTLDFHHIDGNNKEATVARMVSNTYSVKKTLNEIEKCVVLCANCHREFHYLNQNYGVLLEDYLSNDFNNKIAK